MSSEPYVPNLATVESAYVHWALLSDRGIDAADASDEFDRFLSKVKADALREAAEESEQITCEGHGGDDWFPSERVGQAAVWLDVRADRIEGEA